ncbi:MAG: FKBP-type peptidyl-prolyl cis-trans isomerase [Armatimonadetes bacterium]|nr:FKBP-type peptidyl-prolyl cis-trans isomerase [Armatimonadota bacterium]
MTTKSGLKCRDLKVGSGAKATPGKVVTVHYRGWLDNGVEFDSSRSRNEPFSFTLGRGEVIRGWEEGVVGMRAGGTRELAIPPKLGYGNRAVGNIPPNSTLHFEIELLSVGG